MSGYGPFYIALPEFVHSQNHIYFVRRAVIRDAGKKGDHKDHHTKGTATKHEGFGG